MLRVCAFLKSNPRVRGWVALVTQNVLHDRELIRHLAASKCLGLFVGLESFDVDMLRRYRKTQNLSKRYNVIDDIAYAESQGISITYGYLFDPRHQTGVGNGAADSCDCGKSADPDAGLHERRRAACRHRELLGRSERRPARAAICVCAIWTARRSRIRNWPIGRTRSSHSSRGSSVVRGPWLAASAFSSRRFAASSRSGTLNPIRWYFMSAANLHCFVWSRGTPSQPRSYLAGSDTLDPQYFERPDDLSDQDRATYFDPIYLTDAAGGPSDWLKPYLTRRTKRKSEPKRFKSGSVAGGRGLMIIYDTTRESEQLRYLKVDIASFILRYQSKPLTSGRRTLFLFPGGMGSQLLRARTALSGQRHAADLSVRQLLAVTAHISGRSAVPWNAQAWQRLS